MTASSDDAAEVGDRIEQLLVERFDVGVRVRAADGGGTAEGV